LTLRQQRSDFATSSEKFGLEDIESIALQLVDGHAGSDDQHTGPQIPELRNRTLDLHALAKLQAA